MCLIIKKPANVTIGYELLERAVGNNKDGWGLMWAQDGQVETRKGFGLPGLVEAVDTEAFHELGGFVHLRWGTSGKINEDNCHPFRVTDSIYMMHNGVFRINTPNPAMSDTWHFVKNYLRPLLVATPKVFLDPEWQDDISYFVGSNKIVVLNAEGESGIVNEQMWSERDGLLLSNLNSCPLRGGKLWDGYEDWKNSRTSGDQIMHAAAGSNVIALPSTTGGTSPKDQSGNVAEKDAVSDSVDNYSEEELDRLCDSMVQGGGVPVESKVTLYRQVQRELSERGIIDPDEDFDGDEEDFVASYYARRAAELEESMVPSSLDDLKNLPYDALQHFVLANPEETVALIWQADYPVATAELVH